MQEEPYLGKFQANWYRTLRGEMINGEVKWVEKAVSHLQLKSFVARVTKNGADHKITAIALNDGTPIKTVEVKVDDGPWMAATRGSGDHREVRLEAVSLHLEERAGRRAHAGVARRPTPTAWCSRPPKEIESKKTFLEDNSQHPAQGHAHHVALQPPPSPARYQPTCLGAL